MFLKSSRQKKIDQLKKRDANIEASYLVDDKTASEEEIVRQGMFLGIYEQLVRILHRNTDNIPDEVKNIGFYKLALVTYVNLYCQVVIAPKFPEGARDIGDYALSKFLNMDYEKIVDLPEPIADEDVQWVNATRRMMTVFGIQDGSLLWIMEQFMSQLTETEVKYGLAEENKPTRF